MTSKISYLRISLTDKCNLKCIYCSDIKSRKYLPYSELLTYEDILLLQKAAWDIGIKKIRLTGGEPLVRKNISYLIKEMLKRCPDMELALTTNGQLLPGLGMDILSSGITAVNISLDSLNADKYREMTRGGELKQVSRAIKMAMDAGIPKIKVNVVLIRGINEEGIIPFAELARDNNLRVRFIEFMPIGKNGWKLEHVITAPEVRDVISKEMNIYQTIVSADTITGPETLYTIKGGKGSLGFINPVSCKFCSDCNRIRITCSGNLKPCLFSNEEISIKEIIRAKPFSHQRLKESLERCIEIKQKMTKCQSTDSVVYNKAIKKEMWAIGG